MTTTLDKVRAKIIEAVPEIKGCTWGGCMQLRCEDPKHYRDITLADVLRAIGRDRDYNTSAYYLYMKEEAWKPVWDLRTSTLDEQEPEVIEFLGKVLGV